MKPYRIAAPLAALAALALIPVGAASAQRQATPEQRIDRLEKQLRQVQHQLFPRGAPADSAGFSDDPAATQAAVGAIDGRLSTLERQLSEILRAQEENGHRIATMEGDLARARSDQDQRIGALEQRVAAAAAAPVVSVPVGVPVPQQQVPPHPRPQPIGAIVPAPAAAEPAVAADDPGEDAYSQGFRQWQAGNFSQAILTLRSFTAAFPRHHRVSWANNLIGRSLLDSGQPALAATALLANYRSNPAGERAADSLYYLGQADMKLGQPAQACKAYAELESVYGATLRADLRKLVTSGKADAGCS